MYTIRTIIAIIICSTTMNGHFAKALTYNAVEMLYDKLFVDYNNNIQPISDYNSPVAVNVTFNLLSIKEFDEVNGEFSVTGYFTLSWYDHRMSWNPSDYNDTDSIILPSSKVWKPPLVLVNVFDKMGRFGSDDFFVEYTSDGLAYWYPGDVISSSCAADVTYFPFDKQSCVLLFELWDYTISYVTLHAIDSDISLDYYTEHGTWELLKSYTLDYIEDDLSMVDIRINIKRRPTFYVLCYVLPVLLLIPLSIMVFFLPIESGERVSYSITVLLAVAVFLTLVGDNLPKTSKPMSYLCYYLIAGFVLNSVCCCINMASIYVYYIPNSMPIPMWIKRIFQYRNRPKQKNKIIDIRDEKGIAVVSKAYLENSESGKVGKDCIVTWKMVSKFLDKAMVVVITLGFIALLTSYGIVMANNK